MTIVVKLNKPLTTFFMATKMIEHRWTLSAENDPIAEQIGPWSTYNPMLIINIRIKSVIDKIINKRDRDRKFTPSDFKTSISWRSVSFWGGGRSLPAIEWSENSAEKVNPVKTVIIRAIFWNEFFERSAPNTEINIDVMMITEIRKMCLSPSPW